MIDFIIAGTFKSASSTLAYELGQHPHIDIPKPKDPYFYLAEMCRDMTGPDGFMDEHNAHSVYDRKCFEALFQKNGAGVLRGEATPLYLYCHNQAIPTIQADNPDARIVIVLRNPIDRAFSNYKHNVKDGYETRSFAACIANWETAERLPQHPFFHYVRAGFYDAQISAWQAAFKRVKIVSYDAVQTRPHEILNAIAEFLDITPSFEPREVIRLNKSGQPRSRLIHNFIRNETALKTLMRPLYRAILGNRATRKALSERVKNLNLKSGEMASADRAALRALFEEDLTRLSHRPDCAFAAAWLT